MKTYRNPCRYPCLKAMNYRTWADEKFTQKQYLIRHVQLPICQLLSCSISTCIRCRELGAAGLATPWFKTPRLTDRRRGAGMRTLIPTLAAHQCCGIFVRVDWYYCGGRYWGRLCLQDPNRIRIVEHVQRVNINSIFFPSSVFPFRSNSNCIAEITGIDQYRSDI